MPRYSYQAKLSDGQNQSGEIFAENVAAAIAELESRDLVIQSIQLATQDFVESGSRQNSDPASQTEKTMLEHHFVKAVERKEILVPALTALSDEVPAGRGQREIQQLAEAVRTAKSSTDLHRSKVAINWLPLLVTGFNSNSSTQRLSELISFASWESRNRSQRRRLFAYPLALLVLLLVVVAFLCMIALPTFEDMFRDFGLMLPSPTRSVLYISNQVRFHFPRTILLVLIATAVFYGIARLWTHFAVTTRLFGSFTSGNTANVSVMSSLTSQLAELLSINLSLSDALWVAGQGCQHYHFKNVAEQLARDAHGRQDRPSFAWTLSQLARDADGSPRALRNSSVAHNFPANVIHALESGPDGGPNIALLRELSAMYGDRAAQRVDWSSGALAQFAIVMVGLVVGYVVIALFMPLFSMVSSLS